MKEGKGEQGRGGEKVNFADLVGSDHEICSAPFSCLCKSPHAEGVKKKSLLPIAPASSSTI